MLYFVATFLAKAITARPAGFRLLNVSLKPALALPAKAPAKTKRLAQKAA